MRGVDLIVSFELEINKLDDTLNKPVTDNSLYWINQASLKFVKDRFNGNFPKRTSYEQNEKRTKDLINLYREYTVSDIITDDEANVDPFTNEELESIFNDIFSNNGNTNNAHESDANCDWFTKCTYYSKYSSYDSWQFYYPDDLMFVLNEDVVISDNEGGHKLNTSVFECTADNFMYRVNNSLTDFHYRFHRARPLRVRTKDGFKLLTDKNYKIDSYTLGYLKVPEEITNEDPEKDYTDFPEYIWPEIIKIAAQMYIENQSDPRYKTLTNEVLTQE